MSLYDDPREVERVFAQDIDEVHRHFADLAAAQREQVRQIVEKLTGTAESER